MFQRFLFSFILVTLLAGCAGMQQAYQERVCNSEGGFEEGMNDVRAGRPMDQSFAGQCEETRRADALRGYREGYTAGLAPIRNQKPSTQITIQVGPGGGKNIYCEVHAFAKTFAAWGATELEARVAARERCAAEYHEMHCQVVECKSP